MTYYDILGVPYTATRAEIKRAYIAQIKFFHPDVFTDFPEIAKEKSAQLNEAYAILSSPEKRAEYDKSIFGSSSQNRYNPHNNAGCQNNNADSQSNNAGCHSDNTSPPHHEQATSTESAHEESNTAHHNEQSTSSEPAHEKSSTPPPNQPQQNSSQRDKEKFFYTVKVVIIELFIIAVVLLLIVYIPKGISSLSSSLPAEESQPLPQVLPGSGKILDSVFYTYDAPLTIETQGDGYYLVKLKDKYSHRDVCSVFIYGGRSAHIDVDFGCYELYYAHGDTWYGEELLFGPNTRYYKARDSLLFEWTFGDPDWVSVDLYSQTGGNLAVSRISGLEF